MIWRKILCLWLAALLSFDAGVAAADPLPPPSYQAAQSLHSNINSAADSFYNVPGDILLEGLRTGQLATLDKDWLPHYPLNTVEWERASPATGPPTDLIGARRALLAGSAPKPSLSLNFLSSTTLDPRITFSRGSNAMMTDATGNLTYAPNNLLIYSQAFGNAGGWTPSGATATSATVAAPDGTTTGSTVQATAGTSGHGVTQSLSGFLTGVVSVYAKAGTNRYLQFYSGATSQAYANFDLQNGVAGTNGTAFTNITITSVGSGWYRCSVYFTIGSASGIHFQLVDSASAAFNESWTAAGTETLYLWGAQQEAVTYQTTPSAYNATASSAYYGSRFDFSPTSIGTPLGLLIEGQGTNLSTYGTQPQNGAWGYTASSISGNTVTGPDGTTTAATWTADGTNATHSVAIPGFSATNGTVYTASLFVKQGTARYFQLTFGGGTFAGTGYANFDSQTGTITAHGGSLVAYGAKGPINGYYRFWIADTCVSSATGNALGYILATGSEGRNPSVTSSGAFSIQYGQSEASAFPTSVVPTASTTATRAADSATMTGANFSSWFNASQGTFVVGFERDNPTSFSVVGSNTGAAQIINITSTGAAYSWNGTSSVMTANVVSTGAVGKAAMTYTPSSRSIVANGGTPAADTNVPWGTQPSALYIGNVTSALYAYGHIRALSYYPTALPASTLQRLTSNLLSAADTFETIRMAANDNEPVYFDMPRTGTRSL